MPDVQESYDDAMFAFSQGDYDSAIRQFQQILHEHPDHFETQLALGMAFYRRGDYPDALREGHKAEVLRPREQLVHTNLSLFYMKSGDKQKAEHHGLQARVAGWRENMDAPGTTPAEDPELRLAKPATPPPSKAPVQFPDMPWKKKPATPAPGADPLVFHSFDAAISTGERVKFVLLSSRIPICASPSMSQFVSVADVDSLKPGQGRTVHVQGREFCLWNLDGQFYCLDDLCPHRGGPLGAGILENGEVFCPLHAWGFDVRTGACSNRPDRPVRTYPTRVVDGQVQIFI